MPIKHHDQSGAADSGVPGVVEPSHWNKDHDLTGLLAALDTLAVQPNGVLAFNASSVPYLAQISTFVLGLLNSANSTALLGTLGAAALASPAFSGNPTVPNQTLGNNSTRIANTAFVAAAIASLVNSSPTTLDTLKELADALGDDPNYATTIATQMGLRLRVDAAQGLTGTQQTQGQSNLGLGSAALKTAGAAAGNVLLLDGSGRIPAVDGSLLTNLPGLPAGLPAWFPASSAPSGWLALNGALVSRTTYAALWTFANGSGNIVTEATWASATSGAFSTGDLSTTFRLPDLRGEFIRGLDGGRGVDSGRTIGSWQADAFASHTHTASGTVGTSANGSFTTTGATIAPAGSASIVVGNTGGSETRPRNVAWLPCIKF